MLLKEKCQPNYSLLSFSRVYVGIPSGGIITTSNDMARYITFHLNNGRVGNRQIISEEVMMWLRQSSSPIDAMQFRSIDSSMVAGAYAMGPGFQLGAFDGKCSKSIEITSDLRFASLGWQFMSHTGQWVSFMSELRLYPDLGFGTFSVNNGPSHIGNVPYNHRFLHNSIFAIVNGSSSFKFSK